MMRGHVLKALAVVGTTMFSVESVLRLCHDELTLCRIEMLAAAHAGFREPMATLWARQWRGFRVVLWHEH